MTARFLVGDVFERMAELPDGSVDLVMTSPPFLALRSYLPEGHPDKAKEIGSEPTPAAFLDTLLELSAEWRRLLAPHGSIAVELGDTYAGSGGSGGDYSSGGMRDGQARFDGTARKARRAAGDFPIRDDYPRPARDRTRTTPDGWPLEKSLCGIPAAYELSLAYGYNVLDRRGPDSPAGRWRVRNLVAWVRPNPPVGALGDKFRPGSSYVTCATLVGDRWFDLDAVRQETKDPDKRGGMPRRSSFPRPNGSGDGDERYADRERLSNPAGAPPLDWWSISPGGYDGAHYAVYPAELCVRPIEAMCPRRVCRSCGCPSRRITDAARYERTDSDRVPARLAKSNGERIAPGVNQHHESGGANTSVVRCTSTTGWTTCGCSGADGLRLDGFHTGPGWRPGLVLDPFGGSGTTGVVATGRGRDCVLIDINEANVDLARDRLGMFLEVDYGRSRPVAS